MSDAKRETAPDPVEGCTLPADGLAERLAWIRREILPHAVTSERLADGLAWELAAAPGLGAKLDALVALERECCPTLRFEHTPIDGTRERLEIHAPDAPHRARLEELFLSGTTPPTSRSAADPATSRPTPRPRSLPAEPPAPPRSCGSGSS